MILRNFIFAEEEIKMFASIILLKNSTWHSSFKVTMHKVV